MDRMEEAGRQAARRAPASTGAACRIRNAWPAARRLCSTACRSWSCSCVSRALYESWSVPLSVLLVIPLGVVGAVLGATLRGLENDVYFQVALLTTIGLSAKNAILIVEFAEAAYLRGADLVDAALEAARLRLRPIIMTSLAFVAGVMPLAVSTGAGANSRISIGTGVVGGTLTATVLAIFLVPLFFVLVRKLFKDRPATAPAPESGVQSEGAQHA